MNARLVQGIFYDFNPNTIHRWRYPDTGQRDPERNTQDFFDAMASPVESWRHGQHTPDRIRNSRVHAQGSLPRVTSFPNSTGRSSLTICAAVHARSNSASKRSVGSRRGRRMSSRRDPRSCTRRSPEVRARTRGRHIPRPFCSRDSPCDVPVAAWLVMTAGCGSSHGEKVHGRRRFFKANRLAGKPDETALTRQGTNMRKMLFP